MTESFFGVVSPSLDGLHSDVRSLAGYEIPYPVRLIKTGNFLVIRGKLPGKNGLPVILKMPRTSEPIGHKKTMWEADFQSRASAVTPFVPPVIEQTTVLLQVDDNKRGGPPTSASYHYQTQEFSLLVMKEIPGGTFKEKIKKDGPLSPFLSRRLRPVASAVDAFGQKAGIVHRDLKPENIVTDITGRGNVIDFEMAVNVDEVVNNREVCYGTFTHKTNVRGFGELMAYGSDAFDLLPNTLDSLYSSHNSYLDWRQSYLPIRVQDVLRRATTDGGYSSCEEVLVDFEKENARPEHTIIYRCAS